MDVFKENGLSGSTGLDIAGQSASCSNLLDMTLGEDGLIHDLPAISPFSTKAGSPTTSILQPMTSGHDTNHSGSFSMSAPKPQPDNLTSSQTSEINRIMIMAERLRSERDELRHELSYLQIESRIERQSLQDQLGAANSELKLAQEAIQRSETSIVELLQAHASKTLSLESENHRLRLAIEATCTVIQELEKATETPVKHDASSFQESSDTSRPGSCCLGTRRTACSEKCPRVSQAVQVLEKEMEQVNEMLREVQEEYEGHKLTCESKASGSQKELALQSRIEELEAKVMRRTEQIGIHQHDIKRLECNLKIAEEQISELSVDLESATGDKQCLVEDCATARNERDISREALHQFETQHEAVLAHLASQKEELSLARISGAEAAADMQKATHAYHNVLVLAVEQTVLTRARRGKLIQAIERQNGRLSAIYEEKQRIQIELDICKAQLSQRSKRITSMKQCLRIHEGLLLALGNELQQQSELAKACHTESKTNAAQITSLQEEIGYLQDTAGQFVDREIERLQQSLAHSQAEEGRLQGEGEAYVKSISQLQSLKDAMESRIAALETELEEAQEDTQSKVVELTGTIESLHTQVAELQDHTASLEGSITDLRSELETTRDQCTILNSRLETAEKFEEELTRIKDELEFSQAAQTRDAITHQDECEKRDARIKSLESGKFALELLHNDKLHATIQRCEEMESQLSTSAQRLQECEVQLQATQSALEESESSIILLQKEKDDVQKELTSVQGQLLRSSEAVHTITHSLEASREELSSANKTIQALREECSRVSQESNTLRLDLQMKTTRYDQTIANLKKNLTEKMSKPTSQDTIHELEERVAELEEELQAKMAEIEENDDRFLEVLKEKKKLLAKIDSLNRKVHLYQKQMGASALSSSSAVPQSVSQSHLEASRPPSATTSIGVPSPIPSIPSSRQAAAIPNPETMPSAVKQQLLAAKAIPMMTHSRITDQQSVTTSRPSTPDSATSSVVSRKRPLPDDFDVVVPMPAQPITASPQTNGLRRAINGLKSGFAPSRNPTPSPTKLKPSVYGISDITNNPRIPSVPPSKVKSKSWLGKRKAEVEQ